MLASEANEFGCQFVILGDSAEITEFTINKTLNIRLDSQPDQFHKTVSYNFVIVHFNSPIMITGPHADIPSHRCKCVHTVPYTTPLIA